MTPLGWATIAVLVMLTLAVIFGLLMAIIVVRSLNRPLPPIMMPPPPPAKETRK